MALLKEEVIQRTNSDYLDKHWNTSTFPWANPFTILLSGSRKILELRQRFIDQRQDSRSPYNPFGSCSFTRWIFCTYFKNHA